MASSVINEAESPRYRLQRSSSAPSLLAKSNKLYLFFWHAYSPVMYVLYEIGLPKPLPPPPPKDAQDAEIRDPMPLFPILQLRTGEYPDQMSCVQLGSKLYFFGGEFNIDDPYIDEDVKNKLKNEKRDVFPREVYIFNLDTQDELLDKLPVRGTPMNSGKASPQAFVADEKIYVVGSTIEMNISDRSKMKDLDPKSFAYFEFYDPVFDKWTVLPNPPIRKVETRWVGQAVVERKALLVAWQRGKERLYCFDLDSREWTKHASLPSYPGDFSGRTQFVENTLYGCYLNTIAAIASLDEEGEEEEEEEEGEGEEEEEEEEEEEAEEVQQAGSLFKRARLLKGHNLHLVSREMGMDAIFNVPPQLQSSMSLLHLGKRCFCYVRTGMPPHPNGSDHALLNDKERFISIVIFEALGETYKVDATRFFRAKFLHSAHYVVKTSFPNEGFIEGCFSPNLTVVERNIYKKKEEGREMGKSLRSPPDSGRLLSLMDNVLGLLRIRVKRGFNLAVRKVHSSSSDPYVIIKMGQQKRKTRAIKKDVNPEWNEDLTLPVTDPNLPIKLFVYDHDIFRDDKMGDAEFDIQYYMDALRKNLQGLPSGTIISRVQPNRQNCLSEESSIMWNEGKVVQDLCLRLRNVECGAVEIQLQWIDLPGSKGLKGL